MATSFAILLGVIIALVIERTTEGVHNSVTPKGQIPSPFIQPGQFPCPIVDYSASTIQIRVDDKYCQYRNISVWFPLSNLTSK